MSLLSYLPDDILNLISIRLNGFDNCFLWMASDSILRQRLINNVITDFDIKYTVPGRYLWPGNFLKKLSKLSRLSLVVHEDFLHIPIQNIELFSIPTLKSLRLGLINFYDFLLKKPFISTRNPGGPRRSPNDEFQNLNEYYSNLEHLEITSSLSHFVLKINFLRFLPQKLKTLSVARPSIDIDGINADPLNANLKLLPSSLTELRLTLESQFSEEPSLDVSVLPLNLTRLNLTLGYEFLEFNRDKVHTMPKKLKTITLQTSNVEQLLPHLPTGLESLTIDCLETPSNYVQFLRHFPNLKHLSSRTRETVQFSDFITNCPPQLQTFTCKSLVLIDLMVPNRLFSDCLTTLLLHDVVGICPEFIASLPQSLTKLMLKAPHDMPASPIQFFSHLPRKLKSLMTNFPVAESISLLPESMTRLCLTTPAPFHASHFDRLPPKLEIFEAKQNVPLSFLKKLPATVTDLTLTLEETVDHETVKLLPKGLKELHLLAPDRITDAVVADLPPCLKSLALHKNTKITDYGISLLPRCLTSLTLSQNKNLTDECIRHLPHNLISLNLNAATRITSNSCKDLPRYMHSLSLAKCKDWDTEMLVASKNQLPQYIKHVHLGNRNAAIEWERFDLLQ